MCCYAKYAMHSKHPYGEEKKIDEKEVKLYIDGVKSMMQNMLNMYCICITDNALCT